MTQENERRRAEDKIREERGREGKTNVREGAEEEYKNRGREAKTGQQKRW